MVTVCLLACTPAAVAIPITIFNTLEGGSGDVDNVLYQTDDEGTTIHATINSKPGFGAVFTSTTALAESGGQASLKALSEVSFTDLCFGLTDGSTFTKLQINPDVLDSEGDGSISFMVTYLMPAGVFNSASFTLNAHGQNFFTILAGEGALMTQVCWTSTVGVADANQYRVGGVARAVSVPDGGASFALLGLALGGVGAFGHLFRRK